ncbi:MAG TPA: lysophospholipid acyltransferase family protein [Chitinophagaceae bacterium]|nr:lysophospholipid acyltransferase family protein [Chitinophagaceae bacterium]
MIKNILGRIFALWAAILFVSTMLIVLLPLWIIGLWKEPRRSLMMQSIYRAWMIVFFFLTGIRLRVKGRENFEHGKNYIVVFNHNSMMDVPVSVPFMPGANKTIAKIEMARIPLFGIVYKRGSVLVDRKDDESRKMSYVKMREVLDMGLHMCIYPEGTRNKTNQPLQRFHDGAFRLSFDSGKAVLPAVIFNTSKALPRKFFYFWPARIELHYLQPVSPTGFASKEDLKEHIFNIMKEHYVSNIKSC